MDESGVQLGRIRGLGDRVEGRIERFIEHDRDAVWRMLTETQALAQWLAPGSIELRVDGAVRIAFADSGTTIESTVLALDPPRMLEYSWSSGGQPQRPLRWELTVAETGTRLVLTVRLPAGEDIARACAGFDAHLEMLAAALEGVPIRFPMELFRKARRGYQELQVR
ncbi:MAG: SRPBCC family protein [Acetobacteraceae bacterium]